MKIFEANITPQVTAYLHENLKEIVSFEIANQKIYEAFGITHFFENREELEILKKNISTTQNLISEPDRTEYGDFQTNIDLANKVVLYLASKNISPQIVIEPTCGKGNFIISALKNLDNIENIFGIEIYKPYIWETKFGIIHFFLENTARKKPNIVIAHCNVFDYDFKAISKLYPEKEILIIGNPPWVTNAQLGTLNSVNLPKKVNFKNHNGLDAITGKGNFDIAEYITLNMIETFQKMRGNILLLVKNAVIKNIIFDQYKNKYPISAIEKLGIDSKKEFNVSVEAALFYAKLHSSPAFHCQEFSFYDIEKPYQKYGWIDDKFVSNIDTYIHSKEIDGKCPFEWRQGLKHDCSNIMELAKINGHYVNGLKQEIQLEEDLVYGMLKSSDLKNTIITETRKYTIVTQRKVGQETKYIQSQYPKTYQYLHQHQASFDARKSSIYLNKPSFSIFGIGDYSFKPYKVAISGLYKTFHFTLVLPQNDKPVMLDDTCYFIGFDKIEFAVYALVLLNSAKTKHFLQAISFADAKRTFTKDVLMRIDLFELAKNYPENEIKTELYKLNEIYQLNLSLDLWATFLAEMSPIPNRQIEMFK